MKKLLKYKKGKPRCQKKTKKKWYIISPYSSILGIWRILILICSFYIYLIGLFIFGFNVSENKEAFFWLNNAIDILFCIDFFIQFLTGIPYPGTNDYNDKLWPIFKKYIKNWFLFDLIALCPTNIFGMHSIAYLIKICRCRHLIWGFNKMQFYIIKILDAFSSKVQISRYLKSVISCFMIFVKLIFIIHLFTCIFIFIATSNKDGNVDSWNLQSEGENLFTLYLDAFFYITSTFTTIGSWNGGITHPNEMIFTMLLQLSGTICTSYVASYIKYLIVSSGTKHEKEERLFDVWTWILYYDLKSLKGFSTLYINNFIGYHLFCYNIDFKAVLNKNPEIYSKLTEETKTSVVNYILKPMKSMFWTFFENFSDETSEAIIQLFQPCIFHKNQMILENGIKSPGIYFIVKGKIIFEIEKNGYCLVRKFKKGSYFGEECCVGQKSLGAYFGGCKKLEVLFLPIEKLKLLLENLNMNEKTKFLRKIFQRRFYFLWIIKNLKKKSNSVEMINSLFLAVMDKKKTILSKSKQFLETLNKITDEDSSLLPPQDKPEEKEEPEPELISHLSPYMNEKQIKKEKNSIAAPEESQISRLPNPLEKNTGLRNTSIPEFQDDLCAQNTKTENRGLTFFNKLSDRKLLLSKKNPAENLNIFNKESQQKEPIETNMATNGSDWEIDENIYCVLDEELSQPKKNNNPNEIHKYSMIRRNNEDNKKINNEIKLKNALNFNDACQNNKENNLIEKDRREAEEVQDQEINITDSELLKGDIGKIVMMYLLSKKTPSKNEIDQDLKCEILNHSIDYPIEEDILNESDLDLSGSIIERQEQSFKKEISNSLKSIKNKIELSLIRFTKAKDSVENELEKVLSFRRRILRSRYLSRNSL